MPTGHLWVPQEQQGLWWWSWFSAVFGFRQFLETGGVLSEPMVAATDADKSGAVFVGDRGVEKVGLGG